MSHHQFSKLKPHRKRSAFTQEELSFLLGLKQHGAISRYESGDRTPDLKTAFAYQAVFGRELTELFPGLLDQVRTEVGARAAQLSQDLTRGGDNHKAQYKLQQLGRLTQEVQHASRV